MPKTPMQPLTLAHLGRHPVEQQVSDALNMARRDAYGPLQGRPEIAFSTRACIRALVAYGNAAALHRALAKRSDALNARLYDAMHAADGVTFIGIFAARRLALVQRQRHLGAQIDQVETHTTRASQVLERFLPRVPLVERGAVDNAIHDTFDPDSEDDFEAAQRILGYLYPEPGNADAD